MSKKERIFPVATMGGRIQSLRIEKKYKREELHDLVCPELSKNPSDSKYKTIYNWESGVSSPNYETLRKICKVLGCTADYLIGLSDCSTKEATEFKKYTGLSEKTFKQLSELNKHHIDIKNVDKGFITELEVLESIINQHNWNILNSMWGRIARKYPAQEIKINMAGNEWKVNPDDLRQSDNMLLYRSILEWVDNYRNIIDSIEG